MIISATVATAMTVAFGEAYIATLYQLLKDSPDRVLSADEVAGAFRRNLEGQ